MSNLTEQWKKGEIPEGFYYVKSNWSDAVEVRYVHNGIDDWKEVLAPVPSYKEWKQLHKFLEEFNALDVAKENQQLKELLYSLKCCLTSQNIEPQIRVEKSLAKIDNAIGEKK